MRDNLATQRLWVALEKVSWRVLAVVATTESDSSVEVANALADVAWQFRGEPTIMLDLRDVGLRLVDYERRRIDERRSRGEIVVLALASIDRNPATSALARAADAAVLVVRAGETSIATAARTVDEIGRPKVAGIIVARPRARLVVAEPAPSAARLVRAK